MGRRPEQITLYARKEKKKLLREASKRSGKSMSSLVFDYALPFWLKHNPKELEDLAEEYGRIKEIQEAKEEERKTGDYLGSFEKMEEKIRRIKERVKNGDITKEIGDILIQQTEDHYELSQTAYEEDILKKKKKRKKSRMSIEEAREKLKTLRMKRWDLNEQQYELCLKYKRDENLKTFSEAVEILIGRED